MWWGRRKLKWGRCVCRQGATPQGPGSPLRGRSAWASRSTRAGVRLLGTALSVLTEPGGPLLAPVLSEAMRGWGAVAAGAGSVILKVKAHTKRSSVVKRAKQ